MGSGAIKETAMKKTMQKLGIMTVLVIAALTSLPKDSFAAKLCSYQYYYDAAHTQLAGYCNGTGCVPLENWCMGDITQYYALVDCLPYCDA
jgi:hypothetical protein